MLNTEIKAETPRLVSPKYQHCVLPYFFWDSYHIVLVAPCCIALEVLCGGEVGGKQGKYTVPCPVAYCVQRVCH
jgi:hypothetical protein